MWDHRLEIESAVEEGIRILSNILQEKMLKAWKS